MASQPEWEDLTIEYGPGESAVALIVRNAEYVGAVFVDDVPVFPFEDTFFVGFESGDFTGLDWEFGGDYFTGLDWEFGGNEVWAADGTNLYEGVYSAHARTEDISASGGYAQLDLPTTIASASIIEYSYFAPVAYPFETLWSRLTNRGPWGAVTSSSRGSCRGTPTASPRMSPGDCRGVLLCRWFVWVKDCNNGNNT